MLILRTGCFRNHDLNYNRSHKRIKNLVMHVQDGPGKQYKVMWTVLTYVCPPPPDDNVKYIDYLTLKL